MTSRAPKFLANPYLDWAQQEGVPIHVDFGVDMLTAETARWDRLGNGCNGAFVHLKGSGEWATVFLYEVPAAGSSAPQQHLFDETFYVLSGHGSMVVEMADGSRNSFEWGPRSLFAPPMNARFRLFNGSGKEPARLASTNNLRILMNIFHNEDFFFENSTAFPDREGRDGFYAGEGEMTSIRPGRHLWETNFVPDLSSFELKPWEERGAGSSNVQFLLGEGCMGAHVSEMPVGRYKKGHRHGAGLHIFSIHGAGYSLFWYEGDQDFKRVDWRHGMCFAPPEGIFHQHLNTSVQPARYLAVGLGSKRYPVVYERRAGSEGARSDVSIKEGGMQIEYQDQDPRIHPMWLNELKKSGAKSQMGDIIDESAMAVSAIAEFR